MPHLLDAINTLNRVGVDLVAIGCNTGHRWYDALSAASSAPILHIADAAIDELEALCPNGPVAVLGTRGVVSSGFYQRKLSQRGFTAYIPDEQRQGHVDAAIAAVKAGDLTKAAQAIKVVLTGFERLGIGAVLLACTELPMAWERSASVGNESMAAIDVNTAFGQAIVRRLLQICPDNADTTEIPQCN